MKHIFERVEKLFEMPWIETGEKVVDLEFEKLRQKPAIMKRIKSEIDLIPEIWDKEDFIEKLFTDFSVMMSHYSIFRDEVEALLPKETT